MYKAYYNEELGRAVFYESLGIIQYPDGIPEPNIEITAEQHAEAFKVGKIAKVIDGVFVVEDLPEPTLEEKQEQWRITLKSKYDAERVRLGTLLLMADDEDEEVEIKAQRIALKVRFDADLAKIEQGINPFE